LNVFPQNSQFIYVIYHTILNDDESIDS
jgi:hypothetical protein